MLAPWSARACCGGMMASTIYLDGSSSSGALHAAAMTMRMVDGEQHDAVSTTAAAAKPLRYRLRCASNSAVTLFGWKSKT